MSRFESASAAYWDSRYRAATFPYGTEPSRTALRAIEIFREHGARNVLVAGCGSGRHVMAMARAGFDVTGFDVSPLAVGLARDAIAGAGLHATIEVRDLLDRSPRATTIDAVFAYSVVQLFASAERPLAAAALLAPLRPGGIAVITAFSREDPAFGDGDEVEPATFRDARNRTAHFFTQDELVALFAPLASDVFVEPISEPDATYVHRLLLLRAVVI
ncbi:MAG: class I SAM-dependent methyltransferase [Planctomycetes bacterium]|nr:class I SAM-dependent methyltransferase [Planctomycetota bacterium]MBI3846430.1 class I SAM-dependent methyltransferase [Planctomycetota bacterium]